MTFQEAYLTKSARTGPDNTLPVDQRVANLHSSLQIGVYVYLYAFCVCVCVGVLRVGVMGVYVSTTCMYLH